jgi:hypothetical protein
VLDTTAAKIYVGVVIYTNSTSRPYESLCAVARGRGYTLTLSKLGPAWGLQVVIPAPAKEEWRAAAVLVPTLEMLDAEAEHLLRWIGDA